MEIEFATKSLQKVACDPKALRRKYGASADRIMLRLNQLMAYPTLADAPSIGLGRCHELKGDLKGHFTVDLKHPYRLLFKPSGVFTCLDDGGIDLKSVTRIIIVDLHIDTHE